MQLLNRYGVRSRPATMIMTGLAQRNGLSLEQFKSPSNSGQSYAVARESLRDDLAIQRVQLAM